MLQAVGNVNDFGCFIFNCPRLRCSSEDTAYPRTVNTTETVERKMFLKVRFNLLTFLFVFEMVPLLDNFRLLFFNTVFWFGFLAVQDVDSRRFSQRVVRSDLLPETCREVPLNHTLVVVAAAGS